MRGLHGADRWPRGALVRHRNRRDRRCRDHHERGLSTLDTPHPLQRAFIDEQAAQCGYCINGMIMTAKDLLDHNPRPTAAEVRDALARNLCRCGTHGRIIRAVLRAAQNAGKT